MAQYTFVCPECKEEYDFRWSFSQHDKLKHEVKCISCGGINLVQKIEKMNFKLTGYGFYNTDVTRGIDPYAISDSEIARN